MAKSAITLSLNSPYHNDCSVHRNLIRNSIDFVVCMRVFVLLACIAICWPHLQLKFLCFVHMELGTMYWIITEHSVFGRLIFYSIQSWIAHRCLRYIRTISVYFKWDINCQITQYSLFFFHVSISLHFEIIEREQKNHWSDQFCTFSTNQSKLHSIYTSES